MDEKQKRLTTIILVVLNLVVWMAFIVPNIGNVTQGIMDAVDTQQVHLPVMDSASVKKESIGHINFQALRDPFTLPGGIPKELAGSPGENKKPSKDNTVKNQQNSYNPAYPPQNATVQNTFVSRFKLIGISKSGDKYIATLKENSHYGASDSGSTPYSYKWDNTVNNQNSAKSYTVTEGEEILGERVVKIGADFVILTKNKMYYKITFSGGYSISDIK